MSGFGAYNRGPAGELLGAFAWKLFHGKPDFVIMNHASIKFGMDSGRETMAMNRSYAHYSLRFLVGGAVCGLATLSAFAAKPPASLPSPADALKLAPIQQEIEYDRPAAADAEKCKVEVDTTGGSKSYVVLGGS